MRENINNGFAIDAGGVVSVVDLDAIVIGPEHVCRKIRLGSRDFLVVSKDFRVKLPNKLLPYLENYVIAPLPFVRHESCSVVCFRACRCEDGEDMVFDMGITFEGDEKFEFGHYFLWNPETGALTLSEELDVSPSGVCRN